MDAENKFKFVALCPPTAEQWRKIYEFSYSPNKLHWKHYLWRSQLPYVRAIVCTTTESDVCIGLIIFVQPETINISYVGNYLVSEQYRGKGIGSKIWSIMLEYTEESRVIILHAYEKMAEKYRSKDIRVPGITFIRVHGTITHLRNALTLWMSERNVLAVSYYIKDIDSDSIISSVLCYDKKLANFDRSSSMKPFFLLADQKKAIFDSKNTVVAVAATFPLHEDKKDCKIEPVYAENLDLALMVLHALIQDVSESEFSDIMLTIPDETENGLKFINFLVNQAKCTVGMKSYRCYSREFKCPIDWDRVFALIAHGQIVSPLA